MSLAPGGREAGAPGRQEAWRAAGLGALSLGALLAWRLGLGLWGALGTDAPLWGLSAAGIAQGADSAVPPAWPALVALLQVGLGLDLATAGWCTAMVAASMVAPTSFLLCRAAGGARGPALALGALVAIHPELLAWGNQVHANSLTALALVAVALAWTLAARPGAGRGVALAAAVLTGLLPLVRETGTVVVLAAVLLAPLLRPRGWQLSLVVLASWWLSPLLVGALPGPTPMAAPWATRSGMALADLSGDGALPNYVVEIPRGQREQYAEWLRSGQLGRVALFHALRSLGLAWDGWLVAAAAGLALLRLPAATSLLQRLRRQLRSPLGPALLVLATLAPAFLLWTQRRHVLLAVPALAAFALATALPDRRPAPSRPLRLLVLGLLLASLATWPARWRNLAAEQQGETLRARSLAELGSWLCQAEPPIRLLGGPIQDVGLYCPLPRHEPDGSAADDHTALVVPAHMARGLVPLGWQLDGPTVADMAVYRSPTPAARCPDGIPEAGTPTLSAGPVHASLIGCAEDQ